MNRPRRKSTAVRKIIESNSDNESTSESSSDHDGNENKKGQKKVKQFHMKKNQDEDFIKLCIEHFDEINSMSTIRGTPASRQVIMNSKNVQKVWESIAKTMNKSMKVSTICHSII